MRAKASNVSGSGKGKRFNPSNNRGNDKRKDTNQPRYTIVDVIGSVMIFVTIILSDLRNNDIQVSNYAANESPVSNYEDQIIE